jgi:hypothetical protein
LGLAAMDFSEGFLLISALSNTFAETEAIPIIFRKSRRVDRYEGDISDLLDLFFLLPFINLACPQSLFHEIFY